MTTTGTTTMRVNVRMNTRLSALLTEEAAWRSCTRSELAAVLIRAHLGYGPELAPADPPPARPTVAGAPTHTSFMLPPALWEEFQGVCRANGRTAPATLTRLIRWLLGDETAPAVLTTAR